MPTTLPTGTPLPNFQPPPTPARTTHQGRYAHLTPTTPSHAPALFAANSQADDSLWTYLSYGPFPDLPAYTHWLTTSCQKPEPLFFTTLPPPPPQPPPLPPYLRITPDHGVLEIGHLCFSPQLQKTPAATEAVYLLLAHAFHLGYRRVEWKCDSLNAPSRTAALRYGFTYEGTFRQHIIYKHRNRDTAWYAMIDHDWPRIDVAFQQWLAPANFTPDGQQRQRLSTLTGPRA